MRRPVGKELGTRRRATRRRDDVGIVALADADERHRSVGGVLRGLVLVGGTSEQHRGGAPGQVGVAREGAEGMAMATM